MSEPEPDNFDDPGLKAAIRRAWGAEECPAALRERVIAVSSEPASLKIEHTRSTLMQGLTFYGWIAAGLMLVAVGLVFHFHPDVPNGRGSPPIALALPTVLADELIARHDECCEAEDHHMPGLPRDDFAAIGRELRQRLGFPILSAKLPGVWDFHGASICLVGSTKSAHLVFERGGGEFVSIFSLPHQFPPAGLANREFSEVAQHHPIAGFATVDGFYCVVGSSKGESLGLEQIRSLRDQLRPDVAGQITRATVAELR